MTLVRRPAPASLVLLLLLLAAVGGPLAQETAGALRGVVHDREFGSPLPRVRVSIVELGLATVTTADGAFLIQRVPAGTYTLSFSKEGYEREVRTGVTVAPGRMADLRVDLAIEVVDLEELVVTGSSFFESGEVGLLELRSISVAVQDAVSADLIRQAGAGDVAGALKLVVGASVVDGKYATVRGLSDRYTGVTLNGVRVPSADPRRRAVQIDIFPTGTLESITVTKTFTPDLQGDFTGGGVDIRTRQMPEGPVLSASIGTEYNSEATFNDQYLTYRGGGVAATGFAGGSRDLPAGATAAQPTYTGPMRLPGTAPFYYSGSDPVVVANRATAQAIDGFTRGFTPVMSVGRDAPGLNYGFSMTGGNRWERDSGVWGFLSSFTYARKYDYYGEGFSNTAQKDTAESPLAFTKQRNDSRGSEEVLLGLLLTGGYEASENHEYSLKLVGNHSGADESRFIREVPNGGSSQELNEVLQYTERSVLSLQGRGDDTFPGLLGGDDAVFGDLVLDYTGSVNFTRQDEPDVRQFKGLYNPVSNSQSRAAGGDLDAAKRIFRDVQELDYQFAGNVTLPFTPWGGLEGRVKAGVFFETSDRDYVQDTFTYSLANVFNDRRNGTDGMDDYYRSNYASWVGSPEEGLWTDLLENPEWLGLVPDERICVLENLATCGEGIRSPDQLLWYIRPSSGDVDYAGAQEIGALYAMAELPLTRWATLIGGIRRESTDLSIVPDAKDDANGEILLIVDNGGGNFSEEKVPEEEARAAIEETYLLPAAGLVFDLTGTMKLRLSYGETIARPTFRELAPVATQEYLAGDNFVGNPELRLSTIRNYDARWEWFPRPGDVLAFSLFHKTIRNPIEYLNIFAAQKYYTTPVNYDQGQVSGFEVEARVALDGLFEPLRHWTVGANYSYLDSEVTVPEDEVVSLADFDLDEPTRRLQGQPDFVLNANVTYDNEDSGTSAGLFYNVTGETLLTGASRAEFGIPNVIEGKYATLDVTFSQKFGAVTLSAKASNLLQQDKTASYVTPRSGSLLKSLRHTPAAYAIGVSYKW